MVHARVRAFTRAALLAAVLATGAPAARAASDTPAGPDGAANLAAYTGCAGGLAIATSFPVAWAALMYCFKIIAEEWNRSF